MSPLRGQSEKGYIPAAADGKDRRSDRWRRGLHVEQGEQWCAGWRCVEAGQEVRWRQRPALADAV